MIDYALWCEIRRLAGTGLSVPKIAKALGLNVKTVAKWVNEPAFRPRKKASRPSKLDAYKPQIQRMLDQHAYTGEQILREIRNSGYPGGRSILQEYLLRVRPPKQKAFATLAFAPGECAQVDWGHAGSVAVGNTRRRLSFFLMSLGYSRMLYLEFTLSEKSFSEFAGKSERMHYGC